MGDTQKAHDEVMELVNELSDPAKMTKEEAHEFYTDLASTLETAADALGID